MRRASAAGRAGKPPVAASFAALPLSFEANLGQAGRPTRFLARGAGYLLYLTDGEAVLGLRAPSPKSKVKGQDSATASTQPLVTALIHMRLAGSNPVRRVTGYDQLPGKANYFIGNDPKKWRTNIPTYAKVRYESVYPGVDVVYYGHQGRLENDFVVAPGADPRTIGLEFQGAQSLSVTGSGDLLLRLPGGEVRLEKPRAYQRAGATERPVSAGFLFKEPDKVGFSIGPYDQRKTLVIDPVLSYSTYLGGSNTDQGAGIAVDGSGNVYVTGFTQSTDFPTVNATNTTLQGSTDAFVTKLNPSGSALIYSTYLGGTNVDQGTGIAVDAFGNAYVTGATLSADFPTTTGAFQTVEHGSSDAFVTKLNPSGSALVYSTYLGGSGNDQGLGIAIDTSIPSNAYVTGSTNSSVVGPFPFPTTLGVFQTALAAGATMNAFVTKVNPTGSALVYSTYLGGAGNDQGLSVAVDGLGSAYVTGFATSTNFPTQSAIQMSNGGGSDVFVTKLNATATAPLIYSTYLGGTGSDHGNAIAVDSTGSAYVTGSTSSSPTSFPIALPAGFQTTLNGATNAFAAKVNPAGSALIYWTYLGGSNSDAGFAITFDGSGDAYVTGRTASFDFPTMNPIESTLAGVSDAFVTEVNPQGSALVFSSFLGGSNGNDFGAAIAVDAAPNIYVAGTASSTDFPTLAGGFQPTPPSGANAFVVKISPGSGSAVSLSKTSLTFPDESVGATSAPLAVTLRNMGSAPLSITNVATCASTNPCVPSSDFGETNNCTSTVNGGGSCVLSVTFSPSARGARSGALSITDSAPGSPQTISLSGKGITPAVTLSPGSLTFGGNQSLGTTSPAQSVTVTNTGTDPLTISGVTISGDFAETNTCGNQVAAGKSCAISVTFTPTAPFSRTGTLSLTDNGPGSPQMVPLSGTGLGPTATLSTGALTFGEQPVGATSGPQTFTLTNNGNASLTISVVSVTGDFTETNNCGGSLAAGTAGAPSSCTFTVTYSPPMTAVAGVASGSVTISDNARGSPHVVNLYGTAVTGPAPEVFLSPSSLFVGFQPVSTPSSAQVLILTNTGNAALALRSIASSGDFALTPTNPCGNQVAAGKNCAIDVTFTPTRTGARIGSLTISDNATGSPHTAALAGIGTDFAVGASPAGATVSAGQSTSFNVMLAPVDGYNQGVTFSCGKLPQNTTCTFAPAAVTLDGTNSVTVKLTVATTKNSLGPPRIGGPRVVLPPPAWSVGLSLILALLVLGMLTAASDRYRAVRLAGLAAAGVLLVLVCEACVINSPKPTGTIPGSYTFTVTAATSVGNGGLSHTVDLGLVVN